MKCCGFLSMTDLQLLSPKQYIPWCYGGQLKGHVYWSCTTALIHLKELLKNLRRSKIRQWYEGGTRGQTLWGWYITTRCANIKMYDFTGMRTIRNRLQQVFTTVENVQSLFPPGCWADTAGHPLSSWQFDAWFLLTTCQSVLQTLNFNCPWQQGLPMANCKRIWLNVRHKWS